MNCQDTGKLIPGYVDSLLPPEEREQVELHFDACEACAVRADHHREIRAEFRAMPKVEPPPQLKVELQVLASRERVRNQYMKSFSTLRAYWLDRMRLMVDNLMRPLALPTTGGLLSAVFFFAVLVPSLGVQPAIENDVPTPLYQDAGVILVPDFVSRRGYEDALIEVQVDNQGRLVNYHLSEGKMNSDIGNMLLFATYNPARMFGRPTSGTFMLRRCRIVVKG